MEQSSNVEITQVGELSYSNLAIKSKINIWENAEHHCDLSKEILACIQDSSHYGSKSQLRKDTLLLQPIFLQLNHSAHNVDLQVVQQLYR